ncbi:alpha/beta fold hydrolase [Candidatus Nomurabacteria bacterium]|nr:alpha/beta fold hydrolase [Candidatus Saccharibacteria bacterium]MCB9839654.1 alpha/beta fold hydrolase [Candidatus Nomurabacteria bacterium]
MNIFYFFRPKPKLFVAFDEGQGEPTIFIHGIASDSSCWDLVRQVLKEVNGRRAIGLDLLGFGNSPKPKSSMYSLEDHAKAIERTIKKMKLNGPCTIVGHSLGGLVAIQLASRQKLNIKQLFVCAPPIYLNEDLKLSVSKYERTTRAKNNVYFSLYKAIARRPNMSLKAARLIANRFSDFYLSEATWVPFKRSLTNSINDQSTFNELANLNLKVTIIYGRLDVFLVPIHYKQAAELNKNIQLTTFNGGHTLSKKFSQVVVEELTTSFRKKPKHL